MGDGRARGGTCDRGFRVFLSVDGLELLKAFQRGVAPVEELGYGMMLGEQLACAPRPSTILNEIIN